MSVTIRRSALGICLCLASVVFGGGRGDAQEILRERFGMEGFGRVGACGDVDHDGIPDLVVANPWVRTADTSGWLGVLSGADLSLIHLVEGTYWDQKFHIPEMLGESLDGAGDFNGDGTPDIVIGSPSFFSMAGRVLVLNGADGGRIFTAIGSPGVFQGLGSVVRGVGDVDGDGFDDIAASDGWGHVMVWRGPSGELLREHSNPGYSPTIDGLGDVDGDGADDYVTGWQEDATSGPGTGAAVVFSGASGTVLHTVYGVRAADNVFAGDYLGTSVAGVGDIDLDGVPDFAVGAPGLWWKMNPDWLGYVRIYSGADAHVLLEVHGNAQFPMLGLSLAGGGDLNGDGVMDLVAGSFVLGEEYLLSGAVAAYCGRTGTVLWRRKGEINVTSTGGHDAFAILGDLDGDGLDDWAFADSGSSPVPAHLFVFAGGAGSAERICVGAPNSTGLGATLELCGPISLGAQELALRVEHAPPGECGTFFYGARETSAAFGDGFLCAGSPLYRLGPPLIADAAGAVFLSLDFAAPPIGTGPGAWLPGTAWTVQFAYRDSGSGGAGFNASDAWRVTPTP